jgi:hypothetical protein
MLLNRDIISEIYPYLERDDFNTLSTINKMFFKTSYDTLILSHMKPLYDTFNYSQKYNRYFKKEWADNAYETCDQLTALIKENFQVKFHCHQNILPELSPSDIEIVEEYYSFDANMCMCRIYKKESNVIGFRNIKLAFQTRSELDINDLDFTSIA